MGFVITDIAGTTLSQLEQTMLSHPVLAGIILFTRNYESKQQLRELCQSIHEINPSLFIAADQEGGRVQRFRDQFVEHLPMQHWGEQFLENPTAAREGLHASITDLTEELRAEGVTLNFIPVLDLDYGHNQVIANRSFGADPQVVISLGQVVIYALHQKNFPAVGKHFPGHGYVSADSHESLPVDSRTLEQIITRDMQPFMQLLAQLDMLMPAHIVYDQVDSLPTTFSKRWLQDILRDQLGYDGVVVSDDVGSMLAVREFGDHSTRVRKALDAGCDWVLFCNQLDARFAVFDSIASYQIPTASANRIQHLMTRYGELRHV